MHGCRGPAGFKFTVLYIALILIVNFLAVAAAVLSHRAFRERLFENYSRFALSLLPLTCMGFLAFHAYYLLTLGPQMLALLGQYFGVEMLSGSVSPLPNGVIQVVQEALMGVGLVWTLITMLQARAVIPEGKVSQTMGSFASCCGGDSPCNLPDNSTGLGFSQIGIMARPIKSSWRHSVGPASRGQSTSS